ncbi:hypothetical protein IMCC3317_34590 [Kordia antarctica]|uniref:Uncharacterized protein n=1 Tax=Kordia antarctica TaxID=1218801 RepID=A0A7L4ZN85_9FLAO|nr:hypothetical protein [Kordia antarctica]QHI38075.1 hypothetical protein IMCC3317_34590 [Kordia antarctica]
MEIANEQQYIKGVNHAYLLAEYQPQLLENLLKSESRNDYFIGLQDGKRLYEKERSQSRLNELNAMQNKKSKDRGLER